jgi:Uma2 family endonuclease
MASTSTLFAGQRIDPEEYRRLGDLGVADEEVRVELIHGRALPMSPKSPPHEKAIAFLSRLLMTVTEPEQFAVRVAAPLTIGPSEPEPDLAVVAAGTPEPRHPGSAALVIEVAVSSHERDLITKPGVYAGAGVTVYWVFDLDFNEVVMHADPADGQYRSVHIVGRQGHLDGSVIGLRDLAVADVIAAANR